MIIIKNCNTDASIAQQLRVAGKIVILADYDARYAKRYGPWRPIIGDVARRFLRCGDLDFGFARVRCPDCRHEMFVAFSCQQRCLCPSCVQVFSSALSLLTDCYHNQNLARYSRQFKNPFQQLSPSA